MNTTPTNDAPVIVENDTGNVIRRATAAEIANPGDLVVNGRECHVARYVADAAGNLFTEAL